MVYQIPCKQCDQVYTGEMGRPLKTRVVEHKRTVSTGYVKNANAVHWMQKGHDMDWDAVEVIDRSSGWKERKIKETMHIRRNRTYNMDSGYSLSPSGTHSLGH